ncbi:MAG: 3-isopropylmalate dehydratase small subunit [Candidatus Omnitrophica bacterium]|nr:3-isopropylmalate dehydratase small subunit [Candidatus Omnitrophota bacterium]
MKPFTTHEGIIATLDRANVDTDQIIPKQFLKSILRTGFGESLFFDWRYLPDGSDNPEFEMNRPAFRNASILVTQNNFGCGSSREHAVWAVDQYGLRVIIAPRKGEGENTIPGFADIFRNNCSKNGILTIELSEQEVRQIFETVNKAPGVKASVDLAAERLTVGDSLSFKFSIDQGVKNRLLNGLDDIGTTLQHQTAIDSFEASHPTYVGSGI